MYEQGIEKEEKKGDSDVIRSKNRILLMQEDISQVSLGAVFV